MAKVSMTVEEFDALRAHLGRLSLDTVEIARQVLVHGLAQSEAAKQNNISKQRVSGMVSRVIAAASGTPRGWERVEVWLPPELANQVRKIEADAKATINQVG